MNTLQQGILDSIAWLKPYGENKSNVVAQFEREYVGGLLKIHNGNVSAAARQAQMDRKHLHDLMKKHGLQSAWSKRMERAPETRRTGT